MISGGDRKMATAFSNADRAEVLTQALPYFKKYYGKTVVVKYGGNAMLTEDLQQQVMEDIVLLHLVGVRVVLVHGGGPEITGMLKRVGKESQFVNGLRVTDKETQTDLLCAGVGGGEKELFCEDARDALLEAGREVGDVDVSTLHLGLIHLVQHGGLEAGEADVVLALHM